MAYKTREDLRILFFGTPEIASAVLSSLIDASFCVAGVVCQEDKKVGRKGILAFPPVKATALSHSIPCFQPHRLRNESDSLKSLDYNIIVCIAYGQIIPDSILDSAPLGAYNLHGSLLPKYRGAAPMQRAIMNGEKVTGVSLMRMVAKMDAGEVFDGEAFPIDQNDNYDSVCAKMADAASRLIVKDLLPLANGSLKGMPQNDEEATFASKILPEDEHLPLDLTAKETHDYIRALSRKPGAYLLLEGKKLKILETEANGPQSNLPIGSLFVESKDLFLALKDGSLKIECLQPEGKKEMDARSFLNGRHGIEGKILS